MEDNINNNDIEIPEGMNENLYTESDEDEPEEPEQSTGEVRRVGFDEVREYASLIMPNGFKIEVGSHIIAADKLLNQSYEIFKKINNLKEKNEPAKKNNSYLG